MVKQLPFNSHDFLTILYATANNVGNIGRFNLQCETKTSFYPVKDKMNPNKIHLKILAL